MRGERVARESRAWLATWLECRACGHVLLVVVVAAL
jgi:hypothetical protein